MLTKETSSKDKQGKEAYFNSVRKRDGSVVPFDKSKITDAIYKAAISVGGEDRIMAEELALAVTLFLRKKFGPNIPSIEEIQDIVEKVLIETGHAKTAKSYILYREGRAQARTALRVRKPITPRGDTTDMSLLVTPMAKDEVVPWDKSKITRALVKEAGLDSELAAEIASAVERKIITSDHRQISTTLIRELVDNELFERGLSTKLKRQTIIGMPTYDLDTLILTKSNENSNISTNNPEAVNLSIAETTLKQYVLQRTFSEDIASAHMKGMIHIHDLGYPRVYCSSHSLEYIKKYGLKLGGLDTQSAPAKYARTLTGHLNTFLACMQAYYAGALGVAYINIMYAPYLEGMGDGELRQEAQYLIFSASQNAFSRGGQSLFTDHNVHTGVPNYLKKIPAIGPKGEYTGKTYGDYEQIAQRFAKAMLNVWRAGDKNGKVFVFPKADFHICDDTFKNPAQRELLEYACQVASENGAPYFVFDRDEVTLSACFTADTKVLITNSSKYVYEKISDIYDRIEGAEEREASQEWKIPTKRYEIINVQGGSTSVVPISGALRRRYRGVIYNVELKDGTSVSATPDHPFLVLKEGRLIRVRADKLEVGDYLPIQKKTKTNLENYITQIDLLEYAYRQKDTKIYVSLPRSLHLPAIYLSKKYNISTRKIKTWNVAYKSKYRYPAWLLYAEGIDAKDGKIVYKSGAQETMPTEIDLSQELARLLGLYLAEGSINGSSVSFAVSQKEPAITEFIVKAIKKIFGTHVWISNDKNWKSRKIETSSKAVAWLISLFIKGNGARNKEITSLVFNTTDEFKKAFIRGFLDGDGYTRESSTSVEVSFHIASEMLAKDLRALLRSIGINSTIRKSISKNPRRKDQKLDSYHVRLANSSLYKLGWGHRYKWETLRNSHSLWKLLPAKEMGINWDRVRNAQRRGGLKRRRHSHITNFVEFYNDSEIVKYVRNGMHFLPVVGIGVSDYDGFVYDFEVNDTQHAFLLPEGLYSSNCCRLRTQIKDNYMIEHPESMRFTGFQNVTINLPQAAYRAGKGNIDGVFKEIDHCIDLAVKAHLQKKEFISRLMAEPGLPLWEIGKTALDGRKYVDLDIATYIIGIIGLNECVQFLTGKQLHEDGDVFKLGLRIISFMYFKAKQAGKRLNLKFSLEESPAESATRRLAKVDLRNYPEAETVIKGDIDNDAYYYTNSIHFAPDAPIDLITRIQKQSKFHTMIESGAIIHAFVGEKLPSAKSIMNLVEKTYYNTQAAQITISPEFTVCNSCNRVELGLKDSCTNCGSENVYGITRIVGYYSKINNWNRSKLGELADRRRHPEYYRVA